MPEDPINLPPPKEEQRAFRPSLQSKAKRAMKDSRSITWGDLKKVAAYLGGALTIASAIVGAIFTFGVSKGATAGETTAIKKSVSDLQEELTSFKDEMRKDVAALKLTNDARWQRHDDFAARMERSMGAVEGYLRILGEKPK